MSRPYRSRSRLALDLLAAIKEEGPVGVSRLLLAANLTHNRLQELLADFEERGWVVSQREGGRLQWRITEKGEGVLANLRRIDAAMQDYGLGL